DLLHEAFGNRVEDQRKGRLLVVSRDDDGDAHTRSSTPSSSAHLTILPRGTGALTLPRAGAKIPGLHASALPPEEDEIVARTAVDVWTSRASTLAGIVVSMRPRQWIKNLVVFAAFGAVLLAYVALNLVYSFWLKEVVIIDVMVIASGFVLRAVGGALVINVPISHWLVMCTILLSLFLALCKRRQELASLDN